MKGSELFANLLAVVSEWTSWINLSLFPRPIVFLLGLTLIFSVLSLCYHKKIKKKIYEKLDEDKFPEYGFLFQSKLVKFLNEDNQIGDNIYWLDGAWGTGKTHFIRTFFERQKYKVREIYYISCFGIKTRSQAEQVLLSEIEARSSLGILTSIPALGGLISGLISWVFSASGLGLMKKDGIVIFDDLERVAYHDSDKAMDNPADYNDILGFIDYLANHKNQKVIVVYNSADMSETKEKIMIDKFVVSSEIFPLTNNAIEKIVHRDKELNEFYKEFLVKLFQLRLAFGYNNARQILAAQDRLRGKDINISEVLSCLNAYVREMHYERDKNYSNVRHYFFDSFSERRSEAEMIVTPEKNEQNEDDFAFEDNSALIERETIRNPFYWAIVGSREELMAGIRVEEWHPLENAEKDLDEFYEEYKIATKKKEYYENLMGFLWKNGSNYGFRNIVFRDGEYISYQKKKSSGDELIQTLVEIYYDVKNNELKSLYRLDRFYATEDEFNSFKFKVKGLEDYSIEKRLNTAILHEKVER